MMMELVFEELFHLSRQTLIHSMEMENVIGAGIWTTVWATSLKKTKKKQKSRSAKKSELRSNVWVIGGNRSEVLLVLTKSSWLEGMTTHFQTDESAKGPRSECFVLFSGYSTFHTHFRTIMQTFAFLSLSCREPRNNCWISAGRSPPLWKKWAAAFRPLLIKVADKCFLFFCLFFAAQRPQQRRRKHPRRSHDPQETPQLDRRPRRQLLPRHPGDQVSKGDPFLTSDWLIVWASVKRRRGTRGRELRVWELTES